jgi:hypothetical protein
MSVHIGTLLKKFPKPNPSGFPHLPSLHCFLRYGAGTCTVKLAVTGLSATVIS